MLWTNGSATVLGTESVSGSMGNRGIGTTSGRKPSLLARVVNLKGTESAPGIGSSPGTGTNPVFPPASLVAAHAYGPGNIGSVPTFTMGFYLYYGW